MVSFLSTMALLLGTRCIVSQASSQNGITLKTYTNLALYGNPASTSVLPTTHVSLATTTTKSAELSGAVSFPSSGGVYNFNCSFVGTKMAFVWVDGHMVCQDRHAYNPPRGSTDNPLPVNYLHRSKGTVNSLPFRAHFYSDSTSPTMQVNIAWAAMPPAQYESILASARDEASSIAPGGTGGDAVTAIAHRMFNALPHSRLGAADLTPDLPVFEMQRDVLQRSLATGWAPWLHANMLPIVKLPDAATITPSICNTKTGQCASVCVPDGDKVRPGRQSSNPATRVGHHAFDRSYVQFYVGGGDSKNLPINVSVEYSVSGTNNAEIDLLMTPQGSSCNSSCGDWEVQLSGRYAWFKYGGAVAGDNAITFTPPGLPEFKVYAVQKASVLNNQTLSVGFENGPIAFSTNKDATVKSIQANLAAALKKEEALLVKTFGVEKATSGQAIKASAMWTMISTPAENAGAPLLPVSRVWDFTPHAANSDFTYAIFDWDNLFATLLAANGAPVNTTASAASSSSISFSSTERDGFGYAVSNLFQVVKSKTAAGFVPNFAAGGLRSQDRTEPPIGAKVLLQLVEKFGADRMKWVVQALFNDLLDWNDWFIRKRLKPPLNMVALGTFNDQNHQAGNMQDARYESGLDNSPMYDGTFVNTTNGCTLYESGCGLMQLYDVGMTSMWTQEAFSLAKLAPMIGRPKSMSDMLTARAQGMATKVKTHLWDDNKTCFVNRFSADHNNGAFYEHISPTSFYAFQTGAPTDEQAAAMVETYLLNKSHFCIAPNGDYKGNDDTCYWGLPSIEASDPAYPPLGYWRGYIWGPMAQLTYWSLQYYDHVPQVRLARKALCKQMNGLMMSQWNMNRHICENYNPHKTADTSRGDCSGTRFYHWGALTGLIGMMEDGLF